MTTLNILVLHYIWSQLIFRTRHDFN